MTHIKWQWNTFVKLIYANETFKVIFTLEYLSHQTKDNKTSSIIKYETVLCFMRYFVMSELINLKLKFL
jgi:hypothetical protein